MCKQSVPICRTTRQLSGWTKQTLTCAVGAHKEEFQLASELQSLCRDPPWLTIRCLGPYSPMLNPIENVWSKMISQIKQHTRVPAVVCPGVGEQRLQYVETQIDEAMATIMQQDCARCCQHTQGFFVAVLRNEDMALRL